SINTTALNQTDVTWHFNTGAIENTLVTGMQISTERGDRENFNYLVGSQPSIDIINPDSYWAGDVQKTLSAKSNSELDVTAFYAANTFKFSPQWQANIGVRYDHYTLDQETFAFVDGVLTGINAESTVKFDDEIV